jgi:hypothetical protein
VVDLYLPRKRNLPFREIGPQFPGDHPTIVMDCGTLDGHQFEELEQKVKEDAQERLKKHQGRYQAPIRLQITRLIDKVTRKITGYVLEYKRDE